MSNSAETYPAFVSEEAGRSRVLAMSRRKAWRRRLLPAAAIMVFIILWEMAVSLFGIRPYVAPAPTAILKVMVQDYPILLSNLLPTAIEAVLGFLLGNIVAIIVAVAFVYRRTVEETFFPIALTFNTIPIVAKAPILVLILGNGIEPKIAIAALICFFPTLVNMTRGLREVSPEQLELMKVLSASKWEVFTELRLKNSLPFLFAALKINASTAVLGAIVGEWIGATNGIGALIILSTYNFDSTMLYAAVFTGSAFTLFFFAIIAMTERHVLKWKPVQAD